jgi:hypothetical protein
MVIIQVSNIRQRCIAIMHHTTRNQSTPLVEYLLQHNTESTHPPCGISAITQHGINPTPLVEYLRRDLDTYLFGHCIEHPTESIDEQFIKSIFLSQYTMFYIYNIFFCFYYDVANNRPLLECPKRM